MIPERLGELFTRLLPSLRPLVRVPRGVSEDDALHDALVGLLEVANNIPDDPKGAEAAIREAVIRTSKRDRHRRITEHDLFPPPHKWHVGGRSVFSPADREESTRQPVDPIVLLPDTRPDAEEALLTAEADKVGRLVRLVAALEADTGPRGKLYRLVFVERRPQGEVAQMLGILPGTLRLRLFRLRKALREALE